MNTETTSAEMRFTFRFNKRRRRKTPAEPKSKVPRISRLLALAHRMEAQVQDGTVKNYSALANRMRITRARATQILNLLHLALDIQEDLLFLPAVSKGRESITERHLRPITAQVLWNRQRKMWQKTKNVAGLEEVRPVEHSSAADSSVDSTSRN